MFNWEEAPNRAAPVLKFLHLTPGSGRLPSSVRDASPRFSLGTSLSLRDAAPGVCRSGTITELPTATKKWSMSRGQGHTALDVPVDGSAVESHALHDIASFSRGVTTAASR